MLHTKPQTCEMFNYFAVEFHFKFFLKSEISDKMLQVATDFYIPYDIQDTQVKLILLAPGEINPWQSFSKAQLQ